MNEPIAMIFWDGRVCSALAASVSFAPAMVPLENILNCWMAAPKDDQYSKKEAQARFEAALRCARITGHNPLARAFCKLARSRDPTGINQIRYLPRRSASGPRAETHRLTESVRGAHHRLKIGLCARETAGLQTP